MEQQGLVRRAGEGLTLGRCGACWCWRQAGLGYRPLVERALPQDGEAKGAKRSRIVTVNLAESPLGWLKVRGLVDGRQFEAGERLRGDWRLANMAPRVTMRWDDPPRSCVPQGAPAALDPMLAQIAAKRRMEAALEAIGPGLSNALWHIVCAGEGMVTAERALGGPARAGRVVLPLALGRLADFYRLL